LICYEKKILLLTFIISFISNAQNTKLLFEYDLAGNQIKRSLCLFCPSSTGKDAPPKQIEELTEEDLLKFSDKDVISYYPNPVKEELCIKWQLTNDQYVNDISIFSISGQLLRDYKSNIEKNSQNIPFQNYPAGIYFIVLRYSNGDQKSIKIIKK
jgi:hypothetical protein